MNSEITRWCKRCAANLSIDKFTDGAIRRGWKYCRDCANFRRREFFKNNPGARAAAKKSGDRWRATRAGIESQIRARKKYRQTDKYKNRQKREYRKSQYGITHKQYLEFREKHGGKCALCNEEFGAGRICIDHCHATGKVRGIVHHKCNVILGMAGDNHAILRKAIVYLENGGFIGG